MDKKAIKTFAIESRKKLINEIKYQASLLGITPEGIAEPVERAEGMEVYDIGASTPNTIYDISITQRESLVKRINEKGYDNVVEEVAYTWFNRIIAIRFMEVNDYLPTRIRVLSSGTEGKIEPDIVTEAPNIDLDFFDEEIEQIYQLKNDNKLDELFRLLFIKQCNKLNEILPELFEKTADYTELLLSISFTNEDGIVRQLIHNISKEDFTDQVEIIGWLYQYYNTELKDDTFKQLKKRVKISKERIPAATQLFTPDWIVRYMVENSLGRLWLEGHPDSDLKENWKYYLDEAEQEPEVQIELAKIREESKNLKPEDIKVIDPAMGSGHILVYAFDVLMQIYTSAGYSERDAAVSILENNIYGLDIDDRAYQLAYFAVMMKARFHNRKIFTKKIELQICSIQESNEISDELIHFIINNNENLKKEMDYLLNRFLDAKEYGSIIKIKEINFSSLEEHLNLITNKLNSTLDPLYQKEAVNLLKHLLKQSKILAMKYDVVITNPPYMGKNNMDKKLVKFLNTNYPKTKSDLSTVFMEKTLEICKENGYMSMINIPVWMFLSTYNDLREVIINSKTFINMLHLGRGIFGSDFGTTSFVIKKHRIKNYQAIYRKLYVKRGAVDSIEQKKTWFFENKEDNIFRTKQENFQKIPGIPIAYWANERIIDLFENNINLKDISTMKSGKSSSGKNDYFFKFWFEIGFSEIDFECLEYSDLKGKYLPLNKGGAYRRWYGNKEYVSLNQFCSESKNEFQKAVTWSDVNASYFGARLHEAGIIANNVGKRAYIKDDLFNYVLGFLNTKIAQHMLDLIIPTLHFDVGYIGKLPIIIDNEKLSIINKLVRDNIKISKKDWDSFETSWDFKGNPIIKLSELDHSSHELRNILEKHDNDLLKRRKMLKLNEEKLNSIFINIYSLNELFDSNIEYNDVTVSNINTGRDIKSFISYSVGCMLGRYSLDQEGLIFAGGQWDPSRYSKFIPDDDNIIPILDTEYFEDDIVGRFVEFVKVTFGEETLEENLDFIAQALKKKGTTSREVILNYFLTDFYKDHVKTYKKHPIYWLFDSGKNNGFKALIYMHRYEPDLVARVRTDYLHKTQKALETAIAHNDRIIETSTTASEKSKAVKAKNKLVKQLEETRKYDEALAHIANQKMEIDLDDGVKVNYAKFQGLEVSKEGKKVTKIDLLKKI